jgi:hypothetical protein
MDHKAQQFAAEHRRYLQENLPHVLDQFRNEGDLNSYLSSVGQSASDQYFHLLAEMDNAPEVQNLPFHERVVTLQNNQQSAEEIVRDKIIFQPRADSEMDEALTDPIIRDWEKDALDASLKTDPTVNPSQPTSASGKPPSSPSDEFIKPLLDWDEITMDAALEDWPEPKATPFQPTSDLAKPPVSSNDVFLNGAKNRQPKGKT